MKLFPLIVLIVSLSNYLFGQSEIPDNGYSPSGKWLIKEASDDSPGRKELFVPSFVSSISPNLVLPGFGYKLLLQSGSRKQLYHELFTELLLQTTSQDLNLEYEVSKQISAGVKYSGGAIEVLNKLEVVKKNGFVLSELPDQLNVVEMVFAVDAKVQEAAADAIAMYASLSAFREGRYDLLKKIITLSGNSDPEMIAALEDAHIELQTLRTKELEAIRKQKTNSAFLSGSATELLKLIAESQFKTIITTVVGGGTLGASLAVALPMAWIEQLTRGFAAEKSEAFIVLLSTLDRSIFENADIGSSNSDIYTFLQLRTQLSFMIKLAAIEYNNKASGMAKDKLALRTWITGFPYFNQTEFENAKQLAINDIDIRLPNTKKSSDSFIGIILDSSGSMGENDPSDVRKKSAKSIIDQLTGNEFVFLVDFDDQNIWLNQNEWQNWDKNRLKDLISTVNSSGGTDVGGGLNAMKRALQQTSSESLTGYVILLTDGLGNYANEADWFAMNGIKIYTVSYMDRADAKLMSHIAGTTNGLYIQADDENDVIVAFSQFFDDLKGYNKYQSYYGNMGGKNTCELPHFFADDKSALLTGKLNWKTDPLDLIIISPSGIVYSYKPQGVLNTNPDFHPYESYPNLLIAKGGPNAGFDLQENFTAETKPGNEIEWIKGDSYMIVKIQNPEGGEWKSRIITANGTNSNDTFLFEASGSSDLVLKLEENSTGSTYNYSVSGERRNINLKNSRAEITLTSPSGKITDLSSVYKNGTFSFYPMDGTGNYKISATIHFSDISGNPLQRYFIRSKLVGEVLPGYIAPVKETLGTFVITQQSTATGNRAGIKCIIYARGGSSSSPKAIGMVTHVNEKECTIKITDIRGGRIEKGDLVELDFKQWQNDKK